MPRRPTLGRSGGKVKHRPATAGQLRHQPPHSNQTNSTPGFDYSQVTSPPTTVEAVAHSWRAEFQARGFIYLDENKEAVLLTVDMDERLNVWCFCNCFYIAHRFDKCPRCDTPKAMVQAGLG